MTEPECPDLLPEIEKYRPAPDELTPGSRWQFRAKVGGERKIVSVMVRTAPFELEFGQGRTALYVEVFDVHGKWTVPACKIFRHRYV